MLNKAMLAKQNEFNEFTIALRERCRNEDTVLVKTREGWWVAIEFSPADEAYLQDDDLFRSPDFALVWNADGSSVTSKDYDLIEFKE